MKRTLSSLVCVLAIFAQIQITPVAADVDSDLKALQALISQLCDQQNGDCFDLILQIIIQLLITIESALKLGPVSGAQCLQQLFDAILSLVNAITKLVICILTSLLNSLQTSTSECCAFITALVNLLLRLLVKLLQNVAQLVGNLLGFLVGGLPLTAVTGSTSNINKELQYFLGNLSKLLTNETTDCATELLTDIGNDIFACLNTFQDDLKNVTAKLNATVSCTINGTGGLNDIVKQLLTLVANLSATVSGVLALLDSVINSVLGGLNLGALTTLLSGRK